MIQKKSFRAIDFLFLFFFLLSPLFFYNLIPWSSASSTTSPEKEKQSKILANINVNIFMGLCFALPKSWQKEFICLYRNDKTLNIRLQTQTQRPRCWSPKKQMRALSALFYWLLDSWLAPLRGVHLLKEDRAKHCSSAYRSSGGIKGSSPTKSAYVHKNTYTPQIHTKTHKKSVWKRACAYNTT